VPEEIALPDTAEIRRDLEFMTARWDELPDAAVFELRAFKEDCHPQTAKFAPDWIDDAIDWCESMNEMGYNIYVVRNPIRHNAPSKNATDADIIAAFFLWADCDDTEAAGNVKRFDGPKYSAAVTTGKIPSTRVHVYWKLKEPCLDMVEWRDMQTRIAAHFRSDRSVVNPSRIMRVAGTVSYPFRKKQEKGYVKELVRLRTDYPDAREPVTLDQMARVFAETPDSATQTATSGLQVDTGPQPLDRERTRIQALEGQEWHNAVIRLVASYVSRGLSDDEIHGLTDPLTLPGYTVEQTRREVQTAIDGARRKGWTPEEENQFREMTDQERDEVEPLLFEPWGCRDLAAIPYPEFVYSDFYARGYTSVTLAPPKVGKSMLGLAEALDMASGRGILTGCEREKLRVLYYNAEDDQAVIDSRVAALLEFYEIDQSEIASTLFPVSGVERDDFFMISGQDGVINERLFVALEKFIDQQKADVLIFDPLQDLSRSPETNEVFRLLGQRLRRMASGTGVALGIIHHTRKIAPGVTATIEDGRGGSALRGSARFNRLLVSMTEDEAASAGVRNHRHYLRIGDVESNLAPPSADVNRWFEKISVQIPNGREVGAIRTWQWPDAFEDVTRQHAARLRAEIDQMTEPPRADVRSKSWVGEIAANILELNISKASHKAKVKSIISKWIETDVLRVVEVQDSRAGRKAKAVICGATDPLQEVNS
jgi:hypothetical protein